MTSPFLYPHNLPHSLVKTKSNSSIEKSLVILLFNINNRIINDETIRKTISCLTKKERGYLSDTTYEIHSEVVKILRNAYIKHRGNEVLLT